MSTNASPSKPANNSALLRSLIIIMKTLKDTNGRGNFNKTFQYLTKYLSIIIAESDPKDPWAQSYSKASAFINNGRKLGFLGMWLDSFDAVARTDFTDPRKAISGLSQFFTGVYYILDNIVFLQRSTLSNFMSENNQAGRLSMAFFWTAQLLGLFGEYMDIRSTYADEQRIKKDNRREALPEVYKKRKDLFLNVIVRLGNLTYSANGFDLTTSVLGSPFSEKTCAVAGLISGVIALYKNVVAASK